MKKIKSLLIFMLIIMVSPVLFSACSLKRTLQASMISLEQTSYTYDGTEKTPAVTVKLYKTKIISPDDYTVTYENNIEIGQASVTVTMKETCQRMTGSATVYFTIEGTEIGDILNIPETVYNGQNQVPTVSIEGLTLGTDYSLSWEYKTIGSDQSKYTKLENVEFVNAGNYRVTATGIGTYSGTKTAVYTINKVTYTNLSVARNNYTYGTQHSDISLSSSVHGTITYYYSTKSDLSSPVIFDKDTVLNYGTYYFYAKIAETNNSVQYTTPSSFFNVFQANINDFNASIPESVYEFTGSAICPIVTLTNNNNALFLNQDYTVTYSDNTYVGTAKINVLGIGNYTGSKTINFTIENPEECVDHIESEPVTNIIKKATVSENGEYNIATYCTKCGNELSKQNYTVEQININSLTLENSSFDYTGTEITPGVTIDSLTLNKDYELSYNKNINSGTADVVITFIGFYDGTVTKHFTINKIEVEEPTLVTSEFDYTGNPHTITLSNSSDYFTVNGNLSETNAGTYEIVLSLKDSENYVWKNSNNNKNITLSFTINKVSVAKPTLVNTEFTYNGEPQTTTLSYSSDKFSVNGNLSETNAGTYEITISLLDKQNYVWENDNNTIDLPLSFVINKATLEEPTLLNNELNYTGETQTAELSYTSNKFIVSNNLSQINAGTYNVTISLTDKNNYIWKNSNNNEDLTLTFTINGIDISTATIELSSNTFVYTGEPCIPDVTVTHNGKILALLIDYIPVVVNNTNVGTANVVVTGLLNYTGEVETTFEITPQKVTEPQVSGTYNYTGRKQTAKFTGNTKLFEASGHIQTEVGTYDINISLKDKLNYVWETSGTTDDITLQFTIYGTTLSSATVEFLDGNYRYTGEEIKPNILIKLGSILLVEDTDYSITLYDNINAGTATLEINGINSFEGSITKEFTISPQCVEEPTIIGEYTYNGSYQSAELDGNSDLFNVSNNHKYHAGSYIVTVELVDTLNYVWKTSNSNNTLELTFVIKPLAITEPTVVGSYLYDGSPKTAQLSYNAVEFAVSNNTYTEAGTHYVTVSLKNKTNYTWQSSQKSDDLSLKFVIDASKVQFVNSNDYISDLYSKPSVLPTDYSLSDQYIFMPENQFNSNLSWIFASMKTLETSLLKQNGEYHNFSEIGTAYLYYKNYILSKYNYSEIKDIDVVGDFYKFNLTAQNNGVFYENSISNDLYFSLNNSNYDKFLSLENHLDSSLLSNINPINISADSYFKNASLSTKTNILKQYISKYGGVYTTLERGIISCINYTYSTLKQNETSNNDSDGFIENSQSICIIGWDDSKNAFYAINSWGVTSSSYDYFYIPYSYSAMYNELFGYIYTQNDDKVTIETTSAGNLDGFTSKYMANGINPLNLFIYNEQFSISYKFTSNINLDNISVVAFQSDVNVSSLFNFGKSNNVLTITAKDVSALSGTYIFEFYLNGTLISSKDVYVFTGTEVSYIQLLGGTYKSPIGKPTLNNNLSSGSFSQTYYIYDPYDSNCYIDFYLPGIKNYTYNNTIISIGDIFITRTDSNGNVITELKDGSNLLSVTVEQPQQFYKNRQRVLISHLFRNSTNSVVEINIELKSPSNTGTGKTTTYKFIFIVSGNSTATKDNNNKIIYNLNGGENNDKNISVYANYSLDTKMTSYNLYAPTKENCSFVGWYLDENFTQKIENIDSSLSGEIILYAKWSA